MSKRTYRFLLNSDWAQWVGTAPKLLRVHFDESVFGRNHFDLQDIHTKK